MTDLEDILTNLSKSKMNLIDAIAFIERLEVLFGLFDAQADVMGDGEITTKDLLDLINKVLIK